MHLAQRKTERYKLQSQRIRRYPTDAEQKSNRMQTTQHARVPLKNNVTNLLLAQMSDDCVIDVLHNTISRSSKLPQADKRCITIATSASPMWLSCSTRVTPRDDTLFAGAKQDIGVEKSEHA